MRMLHYTAVLLYKKDMTFLSHMLSLIRILETWLSPLSLPLQVLRMVRAHQLCLLLRFMLLVCHLVCLTCLYRLREAMGDRVQQVLPEVRSLRPGPTSICVGHVYFFYDI